MKPRLLLLAVMLGACTLTAQCPPLEPIQGNATPSLCGGPNPNYQFHIYSIANSANADLVWTLSPPTGTFVAGVNTGPSVIVNFHNTGPTQLCATPTNPCYDPTPVCIDLDVQELPYVNIPPIQKVCHGDHVYHEFTGNATYYLWRVTFGLDIGQPLGLNQGTVDFIAKNTGNSVINAHIAIGPWHDPACYGYPALWYLDVYPRPVVNPPSNVVVCGGDPVSVAFSGSNATSFEWTNDNPAIGLAASGTGNIAFTTVMAPQPQTATVTVTPVNEGCTGDPVTFTITVEGSSMDDPPDLIVCPGQEVNIPFSGNAADYVWTNNNPAIGLDAAGNGTIAFTASGATNQQTATVTVTPQPCSFGSQSFTVTVRPRAEATPLPDTVVCAGDSLALTLTGSPGTQFFWTNSNPAIGLDTAGNAPFLHLVAPQVDSAVTGIITVAPVRQGCTGQPITFAITVKKCCATTAGMLDTTTVTVCGPDKIISLALPAGYHLEPGDTLRYILYSNPANPLGSIVQYSDTLLFHFQPDSMHLDSTYFVAVLAGPLAPGDSLLLDAAAKCFSLHKGPKVRWAKKPAMAVAVPPEAVCGDGCVDVQFDLAGTPPFEFTWQVVQNGQVLLSRDETVATGHQHTVMVCPQDFALPAVGNEAVEFRVVWLVDRDCGCFD
jgi:hypothetical protein